MEELPHGVARFRSLLMFAKRYHQHTTIGTENVPLKGGAIVALNHSFATYDGFLPSIDIYEDRGRVPTGLGDNLIFKVPILGNYARQANIYPASPDNAVNLLQKGHVVYISPGGMNEALRPSTEAYQIRWERRKGFVRLSIQAGVPIVLCASRASDDIYTVYNSSLTHWAYKTFKLPLAFIRGAGFTLLPRPVKITHVLGEPIYPPAYDEETFHAQVDAHHALVCDAMKELLAKAPKG